MRNTAPENERYLVGASLLVKNVNDNADILDARGAWAFFASRLAPAKGSSKLVRETVA